MDNFNSVIENKRLSLTSRLSNFPDKKSSETKFYHLSNEAFTNY